jgi:molecular chaperone DnaJ
MARDYYDILGIPRGSSNDEIKKAFRKKAHELHPDKGGDEAAFKEINEAYQVLGDPKKREAYDRFGHAAFQQGGAGGSGFGGFNVNVDDLGDLGDIFGDMFGFGGRSSGGPRKSRGRDVEVRVEIAFMEAVRGTQKTISYRALSTCSTCAGSGAEPGSKTIQCPVCKGSGRVMKVQQTLLGAFQTASVCDKCHGKGSFPERPCHACHGNGVTGETRNLNVDIPAGIDDNETIRISGAGEAAPYGGANGDLYVHLRVKGDPRFGREGGDISSEAYAPVTTMILGGTIEVETVDGIVDLHLPAGTASETVFRLRGKGVPSLHGRSRGDHLVAVKPRIEKRLSHEQKKLLEQLKKEGL